MYVFESLISFFLNPLKLFSHLKSIKFDNRFQAFVSKKEAIFGKSYIVTSWRSLQAKMDVKVPVWQSVWSQG